MCQQTKQTRFRLSNIYSAALIYVMMLMLAGCTSNAPLRNSVQVEVVRSEIFVTPDYDPEAVGRCSKPN